MVSTEGEDREGWGWPMLARKAHYFVGIESLCHAWWYSGTLDNYPELESPSDCVVCRRKLTAKLEKARG